MMVGSNVKYIGLDVHQEAITVAVRNGAGKLIMEAILPTKASALLEFLDGVRGELHVTLEEGTWAAWLYDVLKPHVGDLVCNTRRNALLKEGSKDDRVDARKLSELLRGGLLRAVYHGDSPRHSIDGTILSPFFLRARIRKSRWSFQNVFKKSQFNVATNSNVRVKRIHIKCTGTRKKGGSKPHKSA